MNWPIYASDKAKFSLALSQYQLAQSEIQESNILASLELNLYCSVLIILPAETGLQ